uniref:Uncharacterized 8.7 kDa protein in rpl22-rpl23 intergenic region n=1 Tax=Euglena longa TaxID=3037 RepID=YCX5_EUGLO|nr:hypothetical protein AsloCp21 [Euglena longa]P34779.1 RecName: Full=Uncharacterized 8.7 kDa protein in rpl22-rpl23 intergenic region; AltName: Full=ORF70 [Euglena longa]CAC24592.1 hypothetical protein [Euglena longa]
MIMLIINYIYVINNCIYYKFLLSYLYLYCTVSNWKKYLIFFIKLEDIKVIYLILYKLGYNIINELFFRGK